MTALYDYYELAHPDEGVGSGFQYKTFPHIMLKSIANNPEIKEDMSRKAIDQRSYQRRSARSEPRP